MKLQDWIIASITSNHFYKKTSNSSSFFFISISPTINNFWLDLLFVYVIINPDYLPKSFTMDLSSQFLEGSSSSTHDDRYDVFLSFRGLDTRLNFTDHLYKALVDANITTFLDDEEIETGEELKPELVSAIKASRASIIVLSENYASSTWCLDELVLILEQHRNSGLIVIPIFYHVKPTDVRKQQSSFGDAMAEHKQRMEAERNAEEKGKLAEKMEAWKKALVQVANLKGKDAKGRLEAELIEEVVKDINHRLGLHLRGDRPPLIGVDSSIKTIATWLKDGSLHTIDVLIIFGISGIGKTSLAEYVYELHHHVFDRSSFVKDISRSLDTKFNGIVDLQKQLCEDLSKQRLKDLSTQRLQGHDVSECISNIANTLAHKKVFLVLDDIDSSEQLDLLLGSKDFHPGSKVIITTKDVSLIENCALFDAKVPQKHTELALQGLNWADSLKLFCIHAFICNNPKEGYEEVSKELVGYCAGHPLTLEVLGKLLRNQDVAYWEKHIRKLKAKKVSLINDVLRMSFDSLAYENDKELFKHIACFFVGEDRNSTETILRECGIRTLHGFSNLIERCLLMIGPNNELAMHQLLQEMGRDLVRQESPNKPWKRSRLWCHEDSYNVLKHKKGKGNLLGLALDMKMLEKDKLQGSFELDIDALSTMDDLMLLQLNYVQLTGSIKKFPKKLRWLSMLGFPLKSIPLDLPMKKLVALDLSYSCLETFDMSNSNPRLGQTQNLIESCSQDKRLLGSLKILTLRFCKQLRSLGGFSEFPNLEMLTLANCPRLSNVSESIEQCDKLARIDLSSCTMPVELPRSISKLKNIKTLVLDGCNLGESPTKTRDMALPRMIKYHNLGINSQTSSSATVEAIPRAFKSFMISLPSSLVCLSLKDNNLSDNSFPTDFSSLSMLKELYLDGNDIVSLPDCVKRLPRLEVLSMEKCNILTTLERPPRTLKHLIFDKWYSLQKIVFEREMSPLKFSMGSPWPPYSGLVVEGIFKIEAMSDVAEEILLSLGWTSMEFLNDQHLEATDLMRGTHKVQMDYEFGIFSTMYEGIDIPNWIGDRRKGSSISFTISSPHYNLRGINFCHVITNPNTGYFGRDTNHLLLSSIRVCNITKNRTWIYNRYDYSTTPIPERVILLSHWMFGKNEMGDGDEVTISTKGPPAQPRPLECGISLVYDDGKMEEDPLSYYKSWNHIIGGDLSAFQTTRGEYLLDVTRFFGTISLYCPFFEDNCYYEGTDHIC
ncbi:hypothetical protein OSB04_013174 [Centaurea solstitialis]|uniref:TIR domain-containing protein n=1 Tax=Centaurea solstitialis TaxID=347529 RepID=A0AA38WN42_9ASTR|nr:hypothetical protein OSB04_013174 [Centaurea solstitialis]